MSDTLRERCIEAGRDAMGRNDGWRWWAPRHLAKLFDLWEPMIREQVATEIMAAHGGVMCYHAPAADVSYRVCTHPEDAATARGGAR